MRRLTRKAWFGPKRYLGWGLTVSAWQGVLVTLVAVALVVASVLLLPVPVGLLAAGCVLVAYVVIALLTGDPPGGPSHPASSPRSGVVGVPGLVALGT